MNSLEKQYKELKEKLPDLSYEEFKKLPIDEQCKRQDIAIKIQYLLEDMDYIIDNNSIPSTQEEYDENEEYWESKLMIT